MKRVKAKVQDSIIANQDDKERAIKLNKLPHTKVRLVPKEFDWPMSINVYGDKVGMLVFSDKAIGILIEDKSVAESFRKHFDLVWEMAKKP